MIYMWLMKQLYHLFWSERSKSANCSSLMCSNMFYFHPSFGNIAILTLEASIFLQAFVSPCRRSYTMSCCQTSGQESGGWKKILAKHSMSCHDVRIFDVARPMWLNTKLMAFEFFPAACTFRCGELHREAKRCFFLNEGFQVTFCESHLI